MYGQRTELAAGKFHEKSHKEEDHITAFFKTMNPGVQLSLENFDHKIFTVLSNTYPDLSTTYYANYFSDSQITRKYKIYFQGTA